MIRVALFLLHLAKPLFIWWRVPFDQVRAIVRIKLLLDTRRSGALGLQGYQDTSASMFAAYFFYGIMGAAMGFLLAVIPATIVSYTLLHLFLMFFVGLVLISDYSSVMLDTSDNTIILPRPVASSTLLVARITHIVLYLGQLFLVLAFVPIVVSFVVHGWQAGLVNLVASVLSLAFAFAITGGLYLLLIRFFKEEALKSAINYFQIASTIFLLTAYQVLPRLFDLSDFENLAQQLPVWSVFVPPMWMAGAITPFIDQPHTVLSVACTVLAIAAPFVIVWASRKYLAPMFAARLADLGTATSSAAQAERPRSSWLVVLTRGLTKPGPERAGFELVRHYFQRDRKLKLRIYPSIGYLLVMTVLLVVRSKASDQSWAEFFHALPSTQDHLLVLYACIFIVFGAAFEIFYSDEYKAAWVFVAAPVELPGSVLIGTLKAILFLFLLPFFAVLSLPVLYIWKAAAIPAIVISLAVCSVVILVVLLANEKHLPLSLQPSARSQGSNLARGIMALILIAAIGFGHYHVTRLGAWQWLVVPVAVGLNILLARKYAQLSWQRIRW
jgi:hypothetical protein